MTDIPDEIMAKAREVAMQLKEGFFHADVNVIAAALQTPATHRSTISAGLCGLIGYGRDREFQEVAIFRNFDGKLWVLPAETFNKYYEPYPQAPRQETKND